MEEDAETADLVLVLGTSLGGLSADCVATNSAYRSEAGQSLGSVMINLQQTPKDGMMTLRMFGKSDDILGMLVEELGLGPVVTKQPKWPTKAALVPYDADGVRLAGDSEAPRMWLDLSTGQKVRLTPGHNIQGAKQRQFMHIGADKPVKINGIMREPAIGNGVVMRREQTHWNVAIEGENMRLGIWWLDVAMRGAVDVLPIANLNPRFE